MGIVLIGYRGAGKTTVGRLLAHRLGWPLFDTDAMITGLQGKTIKDIFAERGEAGFRELEQHIIAAVTAIQESVIAPGGGALNRPENRRALTAAGRYIVYLRCTPEALHHRITGDPSSAHARPSLTAHAGSLDEIRQVLGEREPVWRAIMHHEIDVTELSPDAVADQLFDWFTALPSANETGIR